LSPQHAGGRVDPELADAAWDVWTIGNTVKKAAQIGCCEGAPSTLNQARSAKLARSGLALKDEIKVTRQHGFWRSPC
jgi:hypothetical protein